MRPSRDVIMMAKCFVASQRGTCCRRKVGSVLVNARGHILATGYNGPASGRPHCTDHPCPGANLPSGQGLDLCQALHAEQNALLQCSNVYDIETVYVTASPCVTCTKLLLNTSAQRIVFREEYPHPDARILWEEAGRTWYKMSREEDESMVDAFYEILTNLYGKKIQWPLKRP